jgi:drug/metabolite transporter (DMT)-like permease
VLSAFWSAVMLTLSKWSMYELDPVSLVALIMLFGAAAVGVWISITRGWACMATLRGVGWKWTLGLTAFFFFVMYGTFVGLQLLDPTIVAFLSRVETLVAIALGVWLFGERFTRVEIVGATFVILGILALRYSGGIAIERGFWIVLAASVGFGVAEVIAKKTVTIVDPLAFSFVRNLLLGAGFMAAAAVRSRGMMFPGETLGWLVIAAIAISGPFLGRVHYLKALQRIHISKTALISQSQPIWVALLAFIVLRTVPAEREWLGGAIVLLGCVLLVMGRGRTEGRSRVD